MSENVRRNADRTNSRTANSRNNSRRRKNKKNTGSFFTIALLLIISIAGIVAIVFLTKDLLSGDGVIQETTIPFTANIETIDLKTPKGVEVTAQEFINNVDNVEGIGCEFVNTLDFNVIGSTTVELLVKASDGSSKKFTASLEIYEDNTAPVLSGVVDRHFNIGDNITYLKGVTAVDDMEGEVEVQVDNSQIQMDDKGNPLEGNYSVIYTATDKAGNSVNATAIFYFEVNGVNDEMIDTEVDKVIATIIKDDMTIEQKAYAIYNYTYDNIAYTGTSTKGDYRVEAYNGLTKFQGDCYTYFSVAKVLLERIGAKTIDVERAPGARNDHHYWLLVDLGTGYYHFDATRRAYYFDGFMATDAEIAAYSQNVVYGFYNIDSSLYPATPTEEFTFTEYVENSEYTGN